MSSSDDTKDIGYRITGVASSMIALTTIAVALRFWSRRILGFWWDDWTALVAWVLSIPMFSVPIHLTQLGFGRHMDQVPTENLRNFFLEIWITQIFHNLALTIVKISVLLFYVRVFGLRERWFRITLYLVMFLVLAWGIESSFIGYFQCRPVRKSWDIDTPGQCLPRFNIYLASAVLNAATDLLILIMPFPHLIKLQITMRRKIELTIVFILAYFVFAVSLTRIAYTAILNPDMIEDYSWSLVLNYVLLCLELGIGLTCICLPSHVYLFRYFVRKKQKTRSSGAVSDETIVSEVTADRKGIPPAGLEVI